MGDRRRADEAVHRGGRRDRESCCVKTTHVELFPARGPDAALKSDDTPGPGSLSAEMEIFCP
jgi:hypothetical protein